MPATKQSFTGTVLVSGAASGVGGNISGQVIGVDGNTETLANWLDQT